MLPGDRRRDSWGNSYVRRNKLQFRLHSVLSHDVGYKFLVLLLYFPMLWFEK
jgi:hypothetical protein